MKLLNKEYHILIIYDIVQDRRRTKFAEFLNGYGYRVQKSCFEAVISKKHYKSILNHIPDFFDKEEDSIRIYRLTDGVGIMNYGVPCEMPVKRVDVL